MHKTFSLWAVFAALGLLLWLSSLGVGSDLVYRSILMVAGLSWCAWFAWDAPIDQTRQS